MEKHRRLKNRNRRLKNNTYATRSDNMRNRGGKKPLEDKNQPKRGESDQFYSVYQLLD